MNFTPSPGCRADPAGCRRNPEPQGRGSRDSKRHAVAAFSLAQYLLLGHSERKAMPRAGHPCIEQLTFNRFKDSHIIITFPDKYFASSDFNIIHDPFLMDINILI